MDKIGELAEAGSSGGGHWFSYLMGAIIIYHLYKQFKDKGVLDRLELKLEELKKKLK